MGKKHITTGQIKELLIADAKSDGYGEELQELISRITSGGIAWNSDDPREAQAKRYWDLGVGRELGLPSFAAYLASIPEIPEGLKADDASFPFLVLVETRLDLHRLCSLGRVYARHLDEGTFLAHNDRHAEFKTPTWIRMQSGARNRNRSVADCRGAFANHELGLTVLQGVCSYLQHPDIVHDSANGDTYIVVFPGSVHCVYRHRPAYLVVREGWAKIGHYSRDNDVSSRSGAASRRE